MSFNTAEKTCVITFVLHGFASFLAMVMFSQLICCNQVGFGSTVTAFIINFLLSGCSVVSQMGVVRGGAVAVNGRPQASFTANLNYLTTNYF